MSFVTIITAASVSNRRNLRRHRRPFAYGVFGARQSLARIIRVAGDTRAEIAHVWVYYFGESLVYSRVFAFLKRERLRARARVVIGLMQFHDLCLTRLPRSRIIVEGGEYSLRAIYRDHAIGLKRYLNADLIVRVFISLSLARARQINYCQLPVYV